MSAEGQIKAYFQRWERLEGEKKAISDDLKELFKKAKSLGFDGKALRVAFNRKAKLDEGDPADAQFEMTVDTYLDALNGSPRDARLRTRENIEEFDAETGEVRDTKSPRKAAEAVAEMPRNNPVANVEEGATGAIAAASNDPASRTDENGERQHSSTVGFTGDCRTEGKEQSDASAASVGDAAADAHGIPDTNSPEQPTEKDASTDGVTNPSIDGAETGILAEDTRSDANTGGEDVTLEQNAAPIQAGALVSENTPASPMHRNMFAHCWPDLTKAEYEELEDSISVIGIQEPIVRKGDIILDGWNRYNIARSLGEEYPVIEYDGSDELLDVIRWQRSSRDWTPQQEAKIAKALAAEVPARAEEIYAAFHIALNDIGEVVAA